MCRETGALLMRAGANEKCIVFLQSGGGSSTQKVAAAAAPATLVYFSWRITASLAHENFGNNSGASRARERRRDGAAASAGGKKAPRAKERKCVCVCERRYLYERELGGFENLIYEALRARVFTRARVSRSLFKYLCVYVYAGNAQNTR